MNKKFVVRDILAPLRRLLQKMPERDVMMVLSLFVGVSCGLSWSEKFVTIEVYHVVWPQFFLNLQLNSYTTDSHRGLMVLHTTTFS